MPSEVQAPTIQDLTRQYARAGRDRGVLYLTVMARLYAEIGRAEGSKERPWVTIIPDGYWAMQDLDRRIVAQLCRYLGCSPSDFGL